MNLLASREDILRGLAGVERRSGRDGRVAVVRNTDDIVQCRSLLVLRVLLVKVFDVVFREIETFKGRSKVINQPRKTDNKRTSIGRVKEHGTDIVSTA